MPSINRKSPSLPWIKAAAKSTKSWGYSTGFYSLKRWRNLRKSFLMENPLCVECNKKGNLVTATVVDHIIPRRERKDLELEWSNLQSMCEPCHNSKSGKEGRGV